MPFVPRAEQFSLADAAATVEIDAPLRAYDPGASNTLSDSIAARVAEFACDGAALQIGLGKAPAALLRCLTDRRRLRLHSGMLSDGARLLDEAGALDPDFNHMSCVHVGTSGYYEWLDGQRTFAVRGCNETHAAATLAALDGLIAVNSALSVDLFGQANLEMLNSAMVSAVGGAPDFARAAAASSDGINIVALPSVGGRAQSSRIVPMLIGPCSLPRHDIDVVVTEHGAADLRGASVMERAELLIEVAAPPHRGALRDAWRDIAGRL